MRERGTKRSARAIVQRGAMKRTSTVYQTPRVNSLPCLLHPNNSARKGDV
jgi:hypothetical protein